MNREEMRVTLRRLLEHEMGESYPSLEDHFGLKGELGLDSVDLVGLVISVEREWLVRLSVSDLEQVRTVGDLLDLLARAPKATRQDTATSSAA